jgi:hypothetical protein
MPFEETRKICYDYTVTGLQTISQLARASNKKPLRFIYASGSMTERDQTKKPWILGDYSLMRVRYIFYARLGVVLSQERY